MDTNKLKSFNFQSSIFSPISDLFIFVFVPVLGWAYIHFYDDIGTAVVAGVLVFIFFNSFKNIFVSNRI